MENKLQFRMEEEMRNELHEEEFGPEKRYCKKCYVFFLRYCLILICKST